MYSFCDSDIHVDTNFDESDESPINYINISSVNTCCRVIPARPCRAANLEVPTCHDGILTCKHFPHYQLWGDSTGHWWIEQAVEQTVDLGMI